MRKVLTILVLLVATALVLDVGGTSVAFAENVGAVDGSSDSPVLGSVCGDPGGQQGDPDRMGDDPTARGKTGEPAATGDSENSNASRGNPSEIQYFLELMWLLQLFGL